LVGDGCGLGLDRQQLVRDVTEAVVVGGHDVGWVSVGERQEIRML
jgi:hypothetical protein